MCRFVIDSGTTWGGIRVNLVHYAAPFGLAVLPGIVAVARTPAAGNAPAASIQTTMDRVIDPSADALWASVGTIETKRGETHRAPRNDAEWSALQAHARALIAGARTLQRPHLPVGAPGHGALANASVPGTRTPAQIVPTSIATRAASNAPPHALALAVGKLWRRSPRATPHA